MLLLLLLVVVVVVVVEVVLSFCCFVVCCVVVWRRNVEKQSKMLAKIYPQNGRIWSTMGLKSINNYLKIVPKWYLGTNLYPFASLSRSGAPKVERVKVPHPPCGENVVIFGALLARMGTQAEPKIDIFYDIGSFFLSFFRIRFWDDFWIEFFMILGSNSASFLMIFDTCSSSSALDWNLDFWRPLRCFSVFAASSCVCLLRIFVVFWRCILDLFLMEFWSNSGSIWARFWNIFWQKTYFLRILERWFFEYLLKLLRVGQNVEKTVPGA